jgi:hypothetical protein
MVMITQNVKNLIGGGKMNSLFLSWSKRNLSILGKVLIIKALIIPIFTFIVSSCVIPEIYKKRDRE